MKTIMCFGTFDVLHLGHLSYFEQAKQHGDHLIVVIARDFTKQRQKKKVLFNEQERLCLVKELRLVDEVVLGNYKDHFKIIEEKHPAVVFLGYDHPLSAVAIKKALKQRGLHPKILRAKPYLPKRHKSSLLRHWLQEQEGVLR